MWHCHSHSLVQYVCECACAGVVIHLSVQATLSVMHSGWKTLIISPDCEICSVVRLEVNGQQNKVRVRQVQVLAPPTKSLDSSYPATVAQQKACEAEALRVFRSLTSQVYQPSVCVPFSTHDDMYIASDCPAATHGLLYISC